MANFRFAATVAMVLATSTCVPPALYAQDADLFSFIPPGGRTLLGELIGAGKISVDEVTNAARSKEEWSSFLDALGTGFDPVEQETLATYLSQAMPAREKGGKTLATDGHALPSDGRDMVLENCQSCHIITVVVTQDRSREAWLGTMNKPSHVEIDTTKAEREAIADYLTLNGAIPIDDVPEELRAGGATY